MIVSDRTRDQLKNLDDAREKAVEAIRAALVRPIPRKATRPTRASKERRMESKKRRGSDGGGGGSDAPAPLGSSSESTTPAPAQARANSSFVMPYFLVW